MSKDELTSALIELIKLVDDVTMKMYSGEIKLTPAELDEHNRLSGRCEEILELAKGATGSKKTQFDEEYAQLVNSHLALLRRILAGK